MAHDMKNGFAPACDHAVKIILKGIEYVSGGFILTPSEIKQLLGIRSNYATWHLHRKVSVLQKELARHDLTVEINAVQGMSVTLSRYPREEYHAISLWGN